MYRNMSEIILLEQRSYFMQDKRQALILVKQHIKLTRFFMLCHKSIGMPSTKIFVSCVFYF